MQSNTLLKKLKEYKLSGIVKNLDIRIEQAKNDNLGYTEFLELLFEDERNQRSDNRKHRLYRNAKLPFQKGLEEFDFTFQPSIKKGTILELSTCNFISKTENIIFIGQPGTGKTHLSISLGLKALNQDKKVLFSTVWDMIDTLEKSRADLSYRRKLEYYIKPDLLILDELGYRSMGEKTVEDFYEIVSRRYEKGSIIITSNRDISNWEKIFIDKTLTGAILDRLVHHCTIIEIIGDSFRVKNRS